MALTPGARLGPYEVTAQIGVGGMGEVYRATDTNLKRAVAIKVLPASVAADVERLARFQREAEVLASLNHPNIAAIYGLERSGGISGLVMELVEGPTLADRIARGAIPLEEALPIATQIAEALEAAHEQGIIHRDLKPANIKVRPDGTVKVLDFGLAKAMEPTGAMSPSVSQSPTITSPALVTGVGALLGTAAYMSPEQARGRAVDKRSDIWAFGAVLYEMLTGRRAFAGNDAAEVLASVLAREPDWALLPSSLTPALGTYIRRCLHKNPKQRIADAQDIRLALEGAFETTNSQEMAGHGTRPWRQIALAGAGLLASALVVATFMWFATRPAPLRVSRLPVAFSPATTLTVSGSDRDLAITPDGSRVVYVGNSGTQLFVRALDVLTPLAVFTGAPRGPFISPDGRWIGFFDGTALKRVAVTGGPAVTLATVDGNSKGATWGPNDVIVIATDNGASGLQRVGTTGGPTTELTRPNRDAGELDHLWPELLPGGLAVLFTITARSGSLDAAQVVVMDLATGSRTVLLRGGSQAHYMSSGHLVYAGGGTLHAVAFELARLETHGTPVPVVPDVVTTRVGGGVDAVVAADGTLVYVSGGVAVVGSPRTLVWVDRQGHETPIPAPPRAYVFPRLSPDGTRIAVFAQDQDLWLWELSRTTLTQATFGPAIDIYPVWTPDGRRLIFTSDRGGTRNLFWQAADGTGAVDRLSESPNFQTAVSVSPDGGRLIFTETDPKTSDDLMQMTLDPPRRVTPLVQSPFAERNGVVSPDGRWLAYEANDSGRLEIHIRPFPEVMSGHWLVSTTGGTRPLWARSGDELFYVSLTGALMRVGVERGPSWGATTPTLSVKEGYLMSPNYPQGRTYDIAPDGQQFLMIKEGGGLEQIDTDVSLIVVFNWTEELKRLVPTN